MVSNLLVELMGGAYSLVRNLLVEPVGGASSMVRNLLLLVELMVEACPVKEPASRTNGQSLL